MTDFYGFYASDFGLGEAARRLRSLLISSGLKVEQKAISQGIGEGLDGALSILSLNPDQLVRHASRLVKSSKAIGFWAWELESVPGYFRNTAQLLDMVFAISKFTETALSSAGIKARCARLPVPIPSGSVRDQTSSDSQRKKFHVLASFDFSSEELRKNPRAAIDAFKMAFPEQTHAQLTLKSIGGNDRQVLGLRDYVTDRQDINLLTGTMSKSRYSELIAGSAVFLSLHRSEGYGLNLADAMARKVPVIATGYSGNLDFMDEHSSILVPYDLVPVNFYAGLPIKSVWAEPDVEFAARKLRELYEDEKLRREIGEAGYQKILTEHSLPVAVKRFQEEFMNG